MVGFGEEVRCDDFQSFGCTRNVVEVRVAVNNRLKDVQEELKKKLFVFS